MSQPILVVLNNHLFNPLNQPTEIYHYLGCERKNKMIFFRISRKNMVDKDFTVYLVNKKAKSSSKYEVRLETDIQAVHPVEIMDQRPVNLNFYGRQVQLSINISRFSALGIVVSLIFAGFKFFHGIKRVNWVFPASSFALSSIGLIYAVTLQRKNAFGFINVLATCVDLKVRNISNTQTPLLCDESKYKSNPWLPWCI